MWHRNSEPVGASLLAKAVFRLKDMSKYYGPFASKLAPTKKPELHELYVLTGTL